MMDAYLKDFRERLEKYSGSLVRVASVHHPRAKEYLRRLAQEGAVERVDWGWYYVPTRKEPDSALEFVAQDRNFKVVTGQTAASVWNGDFIHREVVSIAVEDPSYKRAVEAFARKRGWEIEAEANPQARKIPHKKVGPLVVEERDRTVLDCFQRWAFVDAIATMSPRIVEKLKEDAYWARIAGTDVRVGQALEYAAHQLYGRGREVSIGDDYVRAELDEAIERVKEFGAGA